MSFIPYIPSHLILSCLSSGSRPSPTHLTDEKTKVTVVTVVTRLQRRKPGFLTFISQNTVRYKVNMSPKLEEKLSIA